MDYYLKGISSSYQNFCDQLQLLSIRINIWRIILPTSFLVLSILPYTTISLILGALSWVIPFRIFIFFENLLYAAYMRSCMFVFEYLAGNEVCIAVSHVTLKYQKFRSIYITIWLISSSNIFLDHAHLAASYAEFAWWWQNSAPSFPTTLFTWAPR